MKKHVKKIEKTITEEKITYEAIDGEVFDNEKECLEYEKSAKGVINAQFQALVIKNTDEYELFRGDGDHPIQVVKVPNVEALYSIKLKINSVRESTISECENKIIDEALADGILLLAWNCDWDWCWPIGSPTAIKNNMDNLLNLKNNG